MEPNTLTIPPPQKPSVGRIVHFYAMSQARPRAAMIIRVWSDSCVNLSVFADDGSTFLAQSVDLAVEGEPTLRKAWVWPPRVGGAS